MYRLLAYEEVNLGFLPHSGEVAGYAHMVIDTNTNYDMKLLLTLNSENHKSNLNLRFATVS